MRSRQTQTGGKQGGMTLLSEDKCTVVPVLNPVARYPWPIRFTEKRGALRTTLWAPLFLPVQAQGFHRSPAPLASVYRPRWLARTSSAISNMRIFNDIQDCPVAA